MKPNMYFNPFSNQALVIFSNAAPRKVKKDTELLFFSFLYLKKIYSWVQNSLS